MAQASPKPGAKDLLSSLNLIHEFTSLFSPKVYNFCRFAQEGLPTEACLCRHQCFSVVA